MGKVVDLSEHRRDSEQREYLLNLLYCCFDLGLHASPGLERRTRIMHYRHEISETKPSKSSNIKKH